MKLFLASSLASLGQELSRFFGSLQGKTVAYITNAADAYIEKEWADIPWITRDREVLIALWVSLLPVDLRETQGADLQSVLNPCDGIFVGWWDVAYLRFIMQKSNADLIVSDLLKWKDYWYIGSSAGSCVMGDRIEFLDPQDERYTQYRWIWFVPATIFPHWWAEKYHDWSIKRVEALMKNKRNIITLTDQQALKVDEHGMRIVENTMKGECGQ